MDLAIIIVSYNTKALLMDCLDSIFGQKWQCSLEVWVVDNGSRDGSPEAVRANYPKSHLICLKGNPGFSSAINSALSRVKTRYSLLLNSDTLILEGALDNMVRFMEEHPKTGVLGPKIYDDKEKTSVQLSCRRFPSWNTVLFNRYSMLTRFFPGNPWSRAYLLSGWDHDSTREVDWLSGSCMMIRREVFEQIGVLDEAFFMFNEDVDICYRASQAGWKVMFFPEAEVVHFIGSSKGKVNPRLIIERHKSIRHYIRKHVVTNPVLAFATDLAVFLRGGILLLINALKS